MTLADSEEVLTNKLKKSLLRGLPWRRYSLARAWIRSQRTSALEATKTTYFVNEMNSARTINEVMTLTFSTRKNFLSLATPDILAGQLRLHKTPLPRYLLHDLKNLSCEDGNDFILISTRCMDVKQNCFLAAFVKYTYVISILLREG